MRRKRTNWARVIEADDLERRKARLQAEVVGCSADMLELLREIADGGGNCWYNGTWGSESRSAALHRLIEGEYVWACDDVARFYGLSPRGCAALGIPWRLMCCSGYAA
jgi:hypothetical protein